MKLPLMVLLSIKTKSYRRLHCTHYKQVILKDIRVLAFKWGAAGWVGTRTHKGNSKKWIRLQSSVLYSDCILGSSPSRASQTSSFPVALRRLVCCAVSRANKISCDMRLRVPPSYNAHDGHKLHPGLHISQWPHAPFTPRHRNTNTALMHFKKILARKRRVTWIFHRETPFSYLQSFTKKEWWLV